MGCDDMISVTQLLLAHNLRHAIFVQKLIQLFLHNQNLLLFISLFFPTTNVFSAI